MHYQYGYRSHTTFLIQFLFVVLTHADIRSITQARRHEKKNPRRHEL